MRQLILVAAVAITLVASFAAEPEITRHVSREAAIKVLRDGGILWGNTRVVSVHWGSDTRESLITLRHPDGNTCRLGLLTQPERTIMEVHASISCVDHLQI